MNQNCCREHVKIIAKKPAAAAAVATSTFAAIVITANIIYQTFMIFSQSAKAALTGN